MEDLISKLTVKDNKYACALADKIISESKESDKWYENFDDFATLLNHPNSLVRNRAIYILAANAQWDCDNKFDLILPDFLSHITDEKPITARNTDYIRLSVCRRCSNRMATLLDEHEDEFAEALEKKANADSIREKKLIEAELQKAIVRNERVAGLYEKLYEDNAEGKVTDEWFMQLSHKYEVERMELKAKIAGYKERLRRLAENNRNKENFISAVRKFMEMKELTPALLHELIERIEVYETEGTGKNRTQRIMIYYRFVGYIEISGGDRKRIHTAETRKGVAVQYLTA